MVAQYRAAMAEHVAEPAWKNLIARLQRASLEFAEMWARHDVRGPENAVKRILHPTAGLLRLEYTYLWLDPRPGDADRHLHAGGRPHGRAARGAAARARRKLRSLSGAPAQVR